MINYEIIDLNNKEKWNRVVKSFSNYDIFYLAEYVEAFKNHGDGEPILFYYNDGLTRAINVVMKRDISNSEYFKDKIENNKYFDLASPYGYGGFIVEGNNNIAVNDAYDNWCLKNGIICEFVRFNLFDKYQEKYNGEIKKIKHNIIRKLNMPIEDMLMDFEHKVRKNLKKAESNGLTIQIDTEGNTLNDFLSIYYETMKRNDAKELYYFTKDFFEIINTMKNNTIYFNVIYNKKVIATELVIYAENNAYSFLGGTLSEYFDLRPNDFLKYEIIKWAYKKGIKNFVLGGGYKNEDDGILRYKKSFAPKDGEVDFYIGKKIFNKEIYNKLVNLRKKEENFDTESNFFPLYMSNDILEKNTIKEDKSIIIIGAGGLGKDIAWMIERINNIKEEWKILGFVDEGISKGTIINNYEVLGGLEILENYSSNTNIVIAIGRARIRKAIFSKISKINKFIYPNLIDPNAIVDTNIQLGRGNTIAAGTIATVNIKMGDFNVINTSCTIGHDTNMKNFITIYPGANVSGTVKMGECIEVGSGSQIIQGRNIESNSIIGMGAVVIHDVKEGTTVIGVPAKNIEDRRKGR